MKVRRIPCLLAIIGIGILAIPLRQRIVSAAVSVLQMVKGKKSIEDRILEFGPSVHLRLDPRFADLGIAYPPKRVVLLGLKEERRLEVFVAGDSGQLRHLKSYPILAASGKLGPKLSEGDHQVPEGLYRIESLNPNSLYHLALRVNYPNAFDQRMAASDGRTELGKDIMIHGKAASVGCLAIGDSAIEELFVLASETGIENLEVLLSPVDLRTRDLPSPRHDLPAWTPALYSELQQAMHRLKP